MFDDQAGDCQVNNFLFVDCSLQSEYNDLLDMLNQTATGEDLDRLQAFKLGNRKQKIQHALLTIIKAFLRDMGLPASIVDSFVIDVIVYAYTYDHELFDEDKFKDHYFLFLLREVFEYYGHWYDYELFGFAMRNGNAFVFQKCELDLSDVGFYVRYPLDMTRVLQLTRDDSAQLRMAFARATDIYMNSISIDQMVAKLRMKKRIEAEQSATELLDSLAMKRCFDQISE